MLALIGTDPLNSLLAAELRPVLERGADADELAARAVARVLAEVAEAVELRAEVLPDCLRRLLAAHRAPLPPRASAPAEAGAGAPCGGIRPPGQRTWRRARPGWLRRRAWLGPGLERPAPRSGRGGPRHDAVGAAGETDAPERQRARGRWGCPIGHPAAAQGRRFTAPRRPPGGAVRQAFLGLLDIERRMAQVDGRT